MKNVFTKCMMYRFWSPATIDRFYNFLWNSVVSSEVSLVSGKFQGFFFSLSLTWTAAKRSTPFLLSSCNFMSSLTGTGLKEVSEGLRQELPNLISTPDLMEVKLDVRLIPGLEQTFCRSNGVSPGTERKMFWTDPVRVNEIWDSLVNELKPRFSGLEFTTIPSSSISFAVS